MPDAIRPQAIADSAWPSPADAAGGARLIERFAALGRAEARLASRPGGAALLACLGGNSPYLADLALREPGTLRALLLRGPDEAATRIMAALARIPPSAPRVRLAAALREAKRRLALAAAIADLGGLWTLEQVTGALSDLAEAALRLSVGHLLLAAHGAGELRLPDPATPERGSGFVVLGMGKLGARELNYSSDVDLVLLYDPGAQSSGARSPHSSSYHEDGNGIALAAVFARVARGLVSLMEARDADGYVFRTDLRLRPDPAATPPAMSLPAALTYYESMGQNWERAAMIKARPVAGDLPVGAGFLEAIRPFVWRRHLDFAAIADIHAMKRRIDAHKGTALDKAGLGGSGDPVAAVAGHNVKLGEGGIREIEFLAQTLQLVWGGRDPALRALDTLTALRLLVRARHLPRAAAVELEAAYRFLRTVEHRLQMVADRQIHALPGKPEELERFAVFMGFSSAAAFAEALLEHMRRVRARYAHLFEFVPDVPDMAGQLDFDGVGDPAPATARALAAMGYRDVRRVVEAVRGWRAGRVRALRSQRARELLDEVLPQLLAALARGPQARADIVFARFDAFLSRLPAGVQILSLFRRNPALLERVASVLGAAPPLADHLASVPSALEGLLSPDRADPHPRRSLRVQLRDARALEEAIGITGRFVRGEEFRLSVATMEGRVDVDEGGLARAALADAAMSCLLPPVMADFARRNGRVRGGGMAVVALGKAGGREMLAGSDLDLMLIYDHPPEVTESAGARRLPVSQYYIRAAHAFVAALTAPGAEGPLYAVDMRLRPSGNKGPVAVSLAGFARYHAESAWTWERMALTRARVVAGPRALTARVQAAIRAALDGAADPDRVRADAAAMRARLARDLPPQGPWDVKLRPGGLMEVEFIAQTLQLVHARAHPGVCSPTTRLALARLRAAGLLPPRDAALLIRADRVWRAVQGMLRITVGRHADDDLPAPAAEALGRALGRDLGLPEAEASGLDLPALRATLEDQARAVRAAFLRHVGDPGRRP